MDKIIFGTKTNAIMGVAVRDIIPKFSLHLHTPYFKNLNPTKEEVSQALNIIERLFQTKISDLDKLQYDLIFQLKNLIILLIRSTDVSPILENIVQGFEAKVNKNWKNQYSLIFDGAMIFNGIVGTDQDPLDIISQILYNNNVKDLNNNQRNQCVSYAILIKEVFYSFTLLKESIEKFDKIPKLELLYETYKKCNTMLQILFGDKDIIFDNNPTGDLRLYRKSRNAYSHLSLIFNGNCFNWGDVIAVERNNRGDYLGTISKDSIIDITWDLTHLLCFLSQVFCIYHLMVPSEETLTKQPSDEKKDEEGETHFFMDYMSGQIYPLETCPMCSKRIVREKENIVRIPDIKIEIQKKDQKLDEIYSIKHKINRPKSFCSVKCFINYIKENMSEEIWVEILKSFKSDN